MRVDGDVAGQPGRAARGIVGTGAEVGPQEGLLLAGPLVARAKATTDLPIGVGLGVSNGAQAAELAGYADAVIVGSAFVRTLLDAGSDRQAGLAALRALTEDLADGVRRG